jgi:hypothetical protein
LVEEEGVPADGEEDGDMFGILMRRKRGEKWKGGRRSGELRM